MIIPWNLQTFVLCLTSSDRSLCIVDTRLETIRIQLDIQMLVVPLH